MYGDNDLQNSLRGLAVKKIYISPDSTHLKFDVTKDGIPQPAVIWVTEGECCSSSWWEEAFSLKSLKNEKVVGVEELTLNSERGSYGDETQWYGISIITTKGIAKFVFRNESNGYYGGYAEVTSNPRFSGDWIEVTKNTLSFASPEDY